jgi:Ca2+-binding EF-hand superfamily protein
MLEFKEFKKAIIDFKLDLEEGDIENIFRHFDKNNDGTLDMNEFMDMILGDIEGHRLQVVV